MTDQQQKFREAVEFVAERLRLVSEDHPGYYERLAEEAIRASAAWRSGEDFRRLISTEGKSEALQVAETLHRLRRGSLDEDTALDAVDNLRSLAPSLLSRQVEAWVAAGRPMLSSSPRTEEQPRD